MSPEKYHFGTENWRGLLKEQEEKAIARREAEKKMFAEFEKQDAERRKRWAKEDEKLKQMLNE